MNELNVMKLKAEVTALWLKKWFVLAAGTPDDFNAMTVGWGALGGMWGKPFAQVVVRPTRHTFRYMEQSATFTLSAFPDACRDQVLLLGTRSGRDTDKIAEAGLTPVPSKMVDAPSFKEAELVLECRKTYWQDMDPDHFLDEAIKRNYEHMDYHRIYYGEIVRAAAAEGTYL